MGNTQCTTVHPHFCGDNCAGAAAATMTATHDGHSNVPSPSGENAERWRKNHPSGKRILPVVSFLISAGQRSHWNCTSKAFPMIFLGMLIAPSLMLWANPDVLPLASQCIEHVANRAKFERTRPLFACRLTTSWTSVLPLLSLLPNLSREFSIRMHGQLPQRIHAIMTAASAHRLPIRANASDQVMLSLLRCNLGDRQFESHRALQALAAARHGAIEAMPIGILVRVECGVVNHQSALCRPSAIVLAGDDCTRRR